MNIKELPSERQCILIRRRRIWEDTKRAFKRASFDSRIGLHVQFIGEDAQDAGGPLREYFRLLWNGIANDGKLFQGESGKKVLTHNITSLQSGDYSTVGRCIALAIVYGGTGPHFLSSSVVQYIFNQPIHSANVMEIPDYEIREKIVKV